MAIILPLLSGCGIHTDYQRPTNLPLDSLYRDIPVNERDTSSIADLSWRELFTDACLAQWIEIGLKQNTDLQTVPLRCAGVLSANRCFVSARFQSTAQGKRR